MRSNHPALSLRDVIWFFGGIRLIGHQFLSDTVLTTENQRLGNGKVKFVLQQEVSDEDELSLFPRYMFSMNIF